MDEGERYFFDLKNTTHKEVYFVVEENLLDDDPEITYKIQQTVKELAADGTQVSFFVYPSGYSGMQIYYKALTHFTQEGADYAEHGKNEREVPTTERGTF